jgi:hypothetical protein
MFKDGCRQTSKNTGLHHVNGDILERILPMLPHVVKRDHRTYAHSVIESILDCLSLPNINYGAIAYISRATGIP